MFARLDLVAGRPSFTRLFLLLLPQLLDPLTLCLCRGHGRDHVATLSCLHTGLAPAALALGLLLGQMLLSAHRSLLSVPASHLSCAWLDEDGKEGVNLGPRWELGGTNARTSTVLDKLYSLSFFLDQFFGALC